MRIRKKVKMSKKARILMEIKIAERTDAMLKQIIEGYLAAAVARGIAIPRGMLK